MESQAFRFYHGQLPNSESSELRFLQGLVHVKALSKDDDARAEGKRNQHAKDKKATSTAVSCKEPPLWLKLWYEAPGTYVKCSGTHGHGNTLLHYLVERGFSHCLREVLNAAQEWFTSESRDRLGGHEAKFHGTLAQPTNLIPSLRGFVDAQDEGSCTALHRAIALEATDMVRLLLVYGASPWYRDPSSGRVPLQLAEGLSHRHQHRGSRPATSDLGIVGKFKNSEDDDAREEGGEDITSAANDPNSGSSRTFAMLEGFPQTYTQQQQAAQPFGLVATNYFLWEPQAVVDAVQRRSYQEAIQHCSHRSVRSALLCTMACTLSRSLQQQDHGGLPLMDAARAQTMIARWCLSALCADVWNEKALELLVDTLEASPHPLRALLALELRTFFTHSVTADTMSTLLVQQGYRTSLSSLQRKADAQGDPVAAETASAHTTRTAGGGSTAALTDDGSELLFPGAKDGQKHFDRATKPTTEAAKAEPTKKVVGRSVIDDVTGDVSVFVQIQVTATENAQEGGVEGRRTNNSPVDSTAQEGGGVWVVLPDSYGSVKSATHGIVKSEVVLGFPYQTGELVVFEPSDPTNGGHRRFLRAERGTSASLSVPQSATEEVKHFVRIWGVNCDDAIEALAEYEWPIVSLAQLVQPGPRSCWSSLLRGRYGEQLWVAQASPQEEEAELSKLVSPTSSSNSSSAAQLLRLGVGTVEWRPQYARRNDFEPGRRVLYDKKTLRFVTVLPEF